MSALGKRQVIGEKFKALKWKQKPILALVTRNGRVDEQCISHRYSRGPESYLLTKMWKTVLLRSSLLSRGSGLDCQGLPRCSGQSGLDKRPALRVGSGGGFERPQNYGGRTVR